MPRVEAAPYSARCSKALGPDGCLLGSARTDEARERQVLHSTRGVRPQSVLLCCSCCLSAGRLCRCLVLLLALVQAVLLCSQAAWPEACMHAVLQGAQRLLWILFQEPPHLTPQVPISWPAAGLPTSRCGTESNHLICWCSSRSRSLRCLCPYPALGPPSCDCCRTHKARHRFGHLEQPSP